jgi:hypothetical protein
LLVLSECTLTGDILIRILEYGGQICKGNPCEIIRRIPEHRYI